MSFTFCWKEAGTTWVPLGRQGRAWPIPGTPPQSGEGQCRAPGQPQPLTSCTSWGWAEAAPGHVGRPSLVGPHDQAGELETSPTVTLVGWGPTGPGGWCGDLAMGSVQGNPGSRAGTIRAVSTSDLRALVSPKAGRLSMAAAVLPALPCVCPPSCLSCSGQSFTCTASVYALPPHGLGFHCWFLFAKHMPTKSSSLMQPRHHFGLRATIWAAKIVI